MNNSHFSSRRQQLDRMEDRRWKENEFIGSHSSREERQYGIHANPSRGIDSRNNAGCNNYNNNNDKRMSPQTNFRHNQPNHSYRHYNQSNFSDRPANVQSNFQNKLKSEYTNYGRKVRPNETSHPQNTTKYSAMNTPRWDRSASLVDDNLPPMRNNNRANKQVTNQSQGRIHENTARDYSSQRHNEFDYQNNKYTKNRGKKSSIDNKQKNEKAYLNVGAARWDQSASLDGDNSINESPNNVKTTSRSQDRADPSKRYNDHSEKNQKRSSQTSINTHDKTKTSTNSQDKMKYSDLSSNRWDHSASLIDNETPDQEQNQVNEKTNNGSNRSTHERVARDYPSQKYRTDPKHNVVVPNSSKTPNDNREQNYRRNQNISTEKSIGSREQIRAHKNSKDKMKYSDLASPRWDHSASLIDDGPTLNEIPSVNQEANNQPQDRPQGNIARDHSSQISGDNHNKNINHKNNKSVKNSFDHKRKDKTTFSNMGASRWDQNSSLIVGTPTLEKKNPRTNVTNNQSRNRADSKQIMTIDEYGKKSHQKSGNKQRRSRTDDSTNSNNNKKNEKMKSNTDVICGNIDNSKSGQSSAIHKFNPNLETQEIMITTEKITTKKEISNEDLMDSTTDETKNIETKKHNMPVQMDHFLTDHKEDARSVNSDVIDLISISSSNNQQ